MVNYHNGKIYRIVCNKTGKQYIGSTVSSLNTRLSQHKRNRQGTSLKVLENGDYNIVLIEDFPCERKEQLLQRERHYIDQMECVNKQLPLRSQHEWYEDNKQRLIEKQKVWNAINKDKCLEYQRRYKNKNKGVYINLNHEDEDIDVDDTNNIILEYLSDDELNAYLDEKINNK
jgi:hypothetical protein